MTRRKRGSSEGYVLAEVLISLSLLGLMAASATLILYQFGTLQKRSVRANQKADVLALQSVLNDTIQSALNEPGHIGRLNAITGDAQQLTVRTRTSFGPLRYGTYEISLEPTQDGDFNQSGYQLAVARLGVENSVFATVFTRDMPASLSVRRISYYARGGAEAPGEWLTYWDQQRSPQLIRIDFGETDNDLTSAMIIGP